MNDLTDCEIEPLRQDGEFAVARVAGRNGLPSRLMVLPVREQPAPSSVAKLENAFSLRDEVDTSWAARPVELVRFRGRPALVIEDPSGQYLDELIVERLAMPDFLHLAIGIVGTLGSLHARGLVHKDVRPANLIMRAGTGQSWLTGFSLTTRLPRHRQPPEPPEIIAGTLAYMAPEQTGRMNRSIDSRSDLYSLGVTFYEMCVGGLPFSASDPIEWVHCHIARLPVAPSLMSSEIPEPISAIILKLLAKAPEDRYQTAAGVEADLRRCLSDLEARGRIEPFSLGARDVPDRLLVPEKLYGREKEIELLLAAFDRVVRQGTTELVLVSGYSGVGKSSVVNELQKVLVPPRGLFASGKFDQYKRDIPYATLAQAFQGLMRQILGKSDAEVARWRESLGDALGPNALLLVNLIPEIELIIGRPPSVPDLPPQEAKNRFQRVLRRFIGVFARPEHPLALFLDDLQWLDTATLELIQHLVADSELEHVLLVGAYRDNEVDPGHPLLRTLQEIRAAGTRVHDIVLSPLEIEDITTLAADALHCPADHSRPMAQLIHAKTGGNPFFAIQFITALAEDELIAFDSAAASWKWDLARILTKGYTDNVVELMIVKLNRLPEATQNVLKQLACVGNSAESATLNLISGEPEEELHPALWEAVRLGLVFRSDNTYSFAHDRIQQAAYSLIPDEQRGDAHLRIGRVLLASMKEDQLAEHLFDVANQLNRGAALLVDHDEKAHVAAIDLRAGRKAKASAAYASALAYFSAGVALLDESDWGCRYELTFNLWLERAECEFLTGALDTAGKLNEQLLQRVTSKVDEAAVYNLKLRLHVMKSDYERAVATALTCLRQLNIDLPAHPTQEQVQIEYETVWNALNGRSTESLIDLPLMTDPALLAAMRVLSDVIVASYFFDYRLWCMVVCRIVQISAQHGTSSPSAHGYAQFGFMLGGEFHLYGEGYRFAALACNLIDKHGFFAGQASVYCVAAAAAVWTKPMVDATDYMQKSIGTAIEAADQAFACYSMFMHIGCLFARGDPLAAVWRESETALDFARKVKYVDAADIIVSQQRFVATMQGRTATFSTFNDAQFDEETFEAQLTEGRMLLMICWYWILKLEARFLSGDYAEALAATDKAKRLIEASAGLIPLLNYFYYTALTVSALYEAAGTDQQQAWRKLLSEHQEQLREWAEGYSPTFADKHALVSAEIARLEGRDADAMRLYEQAIRSAREHGFVQNEGVAYEVAARFYSARGVESIADAYVRNARDCYLRWGADGKVRQLDRFYPHLADQEGPHAAALNATIGAPVGQLDAETVARASQALSSEIVLPKLIERLMRIALEHAGAERGLLILLRGSEPLIEAEATTGYGRVDVQVRPADITSSDLPQSVLQYVIRTRERMVLDDAAGRNLYSDDAYWAQRNAKSVLCLPIVKQTQLIGVLYLENNLTAHAFTSGRVAVLEMLASQAAISLENARLYAELEQENLERRRAEDAFKKSEAFLAEGQRISHTGSWGWNLATDRVVWSEEHCRIFGYNLDQVGGTFAAALERLRPEDRPALLATVGEAVRAGRSFSCEYQIVLPDGSIKQVQSVGRGVVNQLGDVSEYIGTTVDITERKRAEEELRRNDAALREAQAELAHVARVTTMGELAASIAHEVNQPIAGVVINGNACLRWLSDLKEDSVKLTEARETLQRIIRDGNRAGEIIARIKALFKKTESAKEPLDLNEAIREIIVLAKSVMEKQQVTLRLELSPNLPNVLGDRVQLQQVMLNLILNAIDAMATVQDRARDLVIRTQTGEDGTVLTTVRDTGIGLGPESIDHVFTAFHTTKPGGLGMGLSISRSIVDNHAGRLWVEAYEGPGASFCFTLPAEPSPGGPAAWP